MIWLLIYMTLKKNIIHLFTNKIFCTLHCFVNILVIQENKIGIRKVARFKALPQALMNTFWSIRRFRLVNRYRRFEGHYCLLIQGQTVQPEEEGTKFKRNVRNYLTVDTL